MNFKKLVHFGIFNNPLKYISFYETTWKFAFMVHQNVIEIWIKNKHCSLKIFYEVSPYAQFYKRISFLII
jgi:hypothetical protein